MPEDQVQYNVIDHDERSILFTGTKEQCQIYIANNEGEGQMYIESVSGS